MRLIFIFGPAAAGKLTIARELAKLTGLPVFHNHLIVDAVAAVFEFASEPFVKLRHEMWMAMFREASEQDRSLIFTFTPEPSVPDDFIDEVREVVTGRGGEVVFIQRLCSPEEQERRIGSASRGVRQATLARSVEEDPRERSKVPAPIARALHQDRYGRV
jgi:hypothetical protein